MTDVVYERKDGRVITYYIDDGLSEVILLSDRTSIFKFKYSPRTLSNIKYASKLIF